MTIFFANKTKDRIEITPDRIVMYMTTGWPQPGDEISWNTRVFRVQRRLSDLSTDERHAYQVTEVPTQGGIRCQDTNGLME